MYLHACFDVPLSGSMRYLMLLHARINDGVRLAVQVPNLFRQAFAEMANSLVIKIVEPMKSLPQTRVMGTKLIAAIGKTPVSRKIMTRMDGKYANGFIYSIPLIAGDMLGNCETKEQRFYLVSSFAILGMFHGHMTVD